MGSYVYPDWANVLGWMMAGAPVAIILGIMVYQICAGPSDMSIPKVRVRSEIIDQIWRTPLIDQLCDHPHLYQICDGPSDRSIPKIRTRIELI